MGPYISIRNPGTAYQCTADSADGPQFTTFSLNASCNWCRGEKMGGRGEKMKKKLTKLGIYLDI